jgi:hypothetical protein
MIRRNTTDGNHDNDLEWYDSAVLRAPLVWDTTNSSSNWLLSQSPMGRYIALLLPLKTRI